MRIDGVMRDAALLAPQQGYRLINQLKSLGGIDPIAQFGADEARFGLEREEGQIDLRLAVVPSLHGQKLTLRVLDPRQVVYGIHELGLNETSLERIQHWLASLGGVFAVAGPVGAGKTTTLYALLHGLKLQACSVSTLEDPVEYSVDGINQVQIDEEHGLTFPEGLRALARHDPDVILVGELRDAATARAAYGAAALGRTILTTLHSRDAAGAVTTLRYYGLNDRDIATTLSVVVAQRLVRTLCPHCRRETAPTDEEKRWFELIEVPLPDSSWEPGRCDRCGQSGFFGQTGVFEVWRLEEEDYHLLLDGATERAIRTSLAARDHKHFLADALDKARTGVTTLAEVQRLHLAGPALSPGAGGAGAATADGSD
jgi:general secretion pathway protein E